MAKSLDLDVRIDKSSVFYLFIAIDEFKIKDKSNCLFAKYVVNTRR